MFFKRKPLSSFILQPTHSINTLNEINEPRGSLRTHTTTSVIRDKTRPTGQSSAYLFMSLFALGYRNKIEAIGHLP